MNEKIYNDSEYITNKFVEYQKKAKPVYLDFILNYINQSNIKNLDFIFNLLFFFCYTYSEVDAIYIFETIDQKRLGDKQYVLNYFIENKKNISFCSARVKSKNERIFQESCESYFQIFVSKGIEGIVEKIVSKNMGNKLKCIEELENNILKVKNIGSFSSRKFIEMIEYIGKFGEIELLRFFENNSKVDWYISKNMTLGALRCMGETKLHDIFAESGKLTSEEVKRLNIFLSSVSEKIMKYQGGKLVSQNVFVQKLCSFENLYKSKRYGGYHHDRQLIIIRNMEKNNVSKEFIDRMFELRRKSYSKELLGEIGGREGYRNNMKSLRVERGMTGVE